MNESLILAAITQHRMCYEDFERFGSSDLLSPIGRIIYGACSGYYSLDSAVQCVPLEIVAERSGRKLTNPKHDAALKSALGALNTVVSAVNFGHDLRELKRHSIGGKLSLELANGGKFETIERLIGEYQATAQPEGETAGPEIVDAFGGWDTADLRSKPEFLLWPKILNDSCDGGASRGHHILLVARPEQGKTLFAVNLCVGFVKNGHKILYISNEEPTRDIRIRFWQRLLGKSRQWVRDSLSEDEHAMANKYQGQVVIIGLSPGTISEIKSLVEEYKPDIVVLDQLRNLSIKSESRTNQLEIAATEARNIAKKYGVLVVSITQAGDSATDKIYLGMSDIDSSKTGIPATADLMIGLGGDDAMRRSGVLAVSLAKNKLSGRHDQFTVGFNVETGAIT